MVDYTVLAVALQNLTEQTEHPALALKVSLSSPIGLFLPQNKLF
jgi:hypothetical protein